MGANRRGGIMGFAVSLSVATSVMLPADAVALAGFETRVTDPSAVDVTQTSRWQSAIDGNSAVYAGLPLGSQQGKVFRYDLATRESSMLCPSDTWQRWPDVSGTRVVFLEPTPGWPPSPLNQVVLCDVGTSARTILHVDNDLWDLTIDGDRVAISRCNGTCRVLLLEASSPAPFSPVWVDAGPAEPQPRLDGNRMLFYSEIWRRLVAYDIASATQRVLPTGGSDPDVSGDLAVFSTPNANGRGEVVVYDLTTDEVVRRIGGTVGQAMHPRIDGTRLVWEDTRTGSSQIWTMDVAEGVEEAVSPAGHGARFPTVSANHILYQDTRDGTTALYLFTVIRPGDLLRAFDDAAATGAIIGTGPGRSAAPRLAALRGMLATADELIRSGDIAKACEQLMDASARMDGEPRPPDFATGSAAKMLVQMVADLEASLGCGN